MDTTHTTDASRLNHWCTCVQGPAACTQPFCPYYHVAIELIGRRWTGAIVRALLQGVSRFGDLAATIPDLSDRMLSERLKELESEGIVVRLVVPEMPVRIEYHLTPKGRALEPVMAAILAWAEDWLAPTRRAPAPPVAP